MSRRRVIRDGQLEFLAGLALFFGGAYLLWDATEARGRRVPRLLRPITPF
jgi:hypothetical protein